MFKTKSLLQGAVTACVMGLAALSHAADLGVLIGTHNSGADKGFRLAHFDTQTGKLTTPALIMHSDGCAYFIITPDGKFLYTCNSVTNFGGVQHMGALSAFALDTKNGTLKLLNQVPSGGEDPSYISLDKTGKYALVANYQGNRVPGEGGTVAVFALKEDGSFGQRTAFDQHKGTSIDPSRQKQAYAHSIITDPSNRFALCPDLGLDKVFIYKFDEKTGHLIPNDPAFAAVKPGSGPRHVIFHPNGKIVYVVHEMGSMITAFHWDAEKGALSPFQEVSTLPADFKGTSVCAEMRILPDGKWIYASNRGHDSIAQFSVDPQNFKLTLVGTVPSGGQTPRNFDFDPEFKWMLVTNHGDNKAAVFKLDQTTGKLTQSGMSVPVDYPFCPRFFLPSP
ncbi:MAG TPA: lactonase family protein [Phycisphaerae bacterium]